MSVALTLYNQGRLAASFFWDKNQKGGGLDSIERFPSTLARQLASFSTEYESLLVRQLRQPARQPSPSRIAPGTALEKQMRAWVIDPMRKLRHVFSLEEERLIIVLDGLDECGDQEELESLMKLVLLLEELPATFAVLVSCRPESQVTSAWNGARRRGLVIPCENVDMIAKPEMDHTVRCIVEEGLQDRIEKSTWKPSKDDLDAFALACRELPVIASIRVREVRQRTHRGETLESEFRYFRDLTDAPRDVNSEYLRILQRAYMLDSSGVRQRTAERYLQVVGTIIAAHKPFSIHSISEVLKIPEAETYAILEPISSMVDLSLQDTEGLKFYHATAKEFISGKPTGTENDKVFFINDPKGYLLGLPLLQLFNDSCEGDLFGIPTNPPFGAEQKWMHFEERKMYLPDHLQYAVEYLFRHLDPRQLFSQEPSELQNAFRSLLTPQSSLTFTLLSPEGLTLPEEFLPFNDHDVFKLLRETETAIRSLTTHKGGPWHLYRSVLPFIPSSSSSYKLYGHLSDPVEIFSISSQVT
ncbi:uncharacterized protein EI90DRAFT_1765193 [Cantharellus anzutake]|uniref:uncharacterized protein n=1 Tax=Cantharellus anzutake TaxID=1750568 RepID=UPI0019044BDA|nr:uncharacterized protein EI90DRAFT_1765193 [Cantharellus anzutake]KAF8327542.1 hypothetical protein EI90DRAFT_1765193 [Cantharellus anzutake]